MHVTREQQGAAVVDSFNAWRARYRPTTREEQYRFENGLANSSFLRRLREDRYSQVPDRWSQPAREVLPLLHCVPAVDADLRLRGQAAVYGSTSRDKGGFVKRIAPGAIALAKTVHALLSHDDDTAFASTADGSLRFAADRTGLSFEVKPRRHDAMANLAFWLVKQRGWTQCSFGGWIQQDEWVLAQTPNQIDVQIIRRLEVQEISILTFGAFPEARVRIVRQESESLRQPPATPRAVHHDSIPSTFTWNPHVSRKANLAAHKWWSERRSLQPS